MNVLRNLPNINELKMHEELQIYKDSFDEVYFTEVLRNSVDEYRNYVIKNNLDTIAVDDIIAVIKVNFKKSRYNLQRVINGTGTIIHTNLGRSLYSKNVVENITNIASYYNNAEYNIDLMKRGSRYDNIRDIIITLTGAEDVVVVNNNAAAVLLTLTSLVTSSEAIISRGELIEIGGSFRIPEIMKYSNTTICEVGTTNKTHLSDYEEHINSNTKAILKVHPSNFKIHGFTSSVDVAEIAKLCQKNNLISIEDIGSGSLINFSKYTNIKEPTIQDSIKAGIDIVTFSGDKLLGGVQAGFIVGKKEYIDIIKKNNLLRCLRVDKLTIAAIEATLQEYLNEQHAIKTIPTLRMITENKSEVLSRTNKLYSLLNNKSNFIIEECASIIGGGSLPTQTVESYKIIINTTEKPQLLFERMHNNYIPIIAKIENNKAIIDMKAVLEDDINILAEFLNA